MEPSVVAPIDPAIEWTKTVLFRPFDLEKWFVLGFCAWLALLGQSGGASFNFNFSVPAPEQDPSLEEARRWIEDNALMLGGILAGIVLFSIVVGVVLLWVRSRGAFLLLDGVVANRGAVKEPWARLGSLGDSLFGFRLIVGAAGLTVSLAVLGSVGYLVGRELLETGRFESWMVLPVVVGGLLLVASGLVFALIELLLVDFVVPIMYLRTCRVREAWREFAGLAHGRVGTFAVYVLFQIVLAFVLGILGAVATCLTCCLAAIPYLGTVILLPLPVFRRSYALYFLGQFGPEYELLPPGGRPPLEPILEA